MEVKKEIKDPILALDKAGFEVSIVGGAVRDLLTKKEVADWDLTTNAKPEDILKLFKKSFYNNRFGTVGVVLPNKSTVQITTYRTEERYTDKRHPDVIVWGKTLEEDLSRRDFTINAMALRLGSRDQGLGVREEQNSYTLVTIPNTLTLVDPFEGQDDLKKKIIRTVGDPNKRFS